MGADACLYCEGTSSEPLLEDVRDRLGVSPCLWSFRRCTGCGSGLLFPRPKAEELAGFYPPIYDVTPELIQRKKWIGRILAEAEQRLFFLPQYAGQAAGIRRITRSKPGARLLDVGCGGGFRLRAFRRLGFDAEGSDFREEVVRALRKEWGIPAVQSDVSDLSKHFETGSFDLITAFHLVEHLPDVKGFLKTVFSLLKPGGWFICTVPMVNSLQARLLGSRWAGASEAPRHLSIPSPRGIRKALTAAGFSSVRMGPDSALNCTGVAVLSLLPATGLRHAGKSGWEIAAAVPLGTLLFPVCLAENRLLGRPAIALVFAQKPKKG